MLEFCNIMFSMLSNNFSRQNFGIFFCFFFFFFFFFFQNTGFDISWKLSPKKTICLKFQSLSSWKNKKISPIYDLLNLPRVQEMIKKFLAPARWELPRAEIVPLFLNIITLCLDVLSPMLLQFANPSKIEAVFLFP